ncbi:hypothetical protein DFAR_1860003 [Desulfarculales bacterium]
MVAKHQARKGKLQKAEQIMARSGFNTHIGPQTSELLVIA